MKRQIFTVMIVAGLLVQVAHSEEPAAAAPAVGTGAPKIEFDKTTYDFGTTSLVSQLHGVFVISNAGKGVLQLGKPATSCGCTIAGLKVDKLAPGEKTELDFTMNVGANIRAHLEKKITVPSNDPATPSVQLTVKADVAMVYDFNPINIAVGDLRLGASTKSTVAVKRTDGQPLGITKVECNSPFIHAKFEATEGVASAGTISVEVVGEGTAGRFNDALRVIGAAPQPLFVIPIGGRLVGDILLSQEALFWGIADPANWPGPNAQVATTRKITVSSSIDGQSLEVSKLSCTLEDVKVTVAPVMAGKSFEITAVLDKAPKDSLHGIIKFETNIKSQPAVEIPITVNVLRRG